MTQPEPATLTGERKDTEVGSVFVSTYPPFSAWNVEDVPKAHKVLETPGDRNTPLGLYLHIPFCRKRCKFCYFRVYTDKNFDEIGQYLDALSTEVERIAQAPAVEGRPLKFVYFGGGTPSYISVQHLQTLVDRLQSAIPWTGVEEVTFECEPGTLTQSKLEAVREIGVTRLSLGIENFDDEILRENGRAHVSREIERCWPWIQELAFDQVTIDLIAGMVGETWDKWKATVAKTVAWAPDSVTVYQMELPFNTRFSKGLLAGEGEQSFADWSTKRAWNEYAMEQLAEAGYVPSSAYSMVRGDREHRFVYRDAVWEGRDLIGTGVASFSHLQGVHFQNADGWGEYIARVNRGEVPIARALATSLEERWTRRFILQLKRGWVDATEFQRDFSVDVLGLFETPLAELEHKGFLRVVDQRVELTREGLLQADMLLPNFYHEQYRGARYT